MPRTPVSELPAGYDRSYYVPIGEEGFEVGDRVVWVNSLEWGDEWQVGTIVDILDRPFDNLREIHTSVRVKWDKQVTEAEHYSTEALVNKIGESLEIMDVEVFTNLYDVELH